MIESAAQVASFYTRKFVGWQGFIGFGGVDECKFRMQVAPGCRMYVLVKQIWHRHRRILCRAQGMVDGNLVFEASIVGTQM
jgi:3-hydroxyacyl-[acyl-carrier-protein] dehydratase